MGEFLTRSSILAQSFVFYTFSKEFSVWNGEEVEAEADRVYNTIVGLEGRTEAWSLALALLLGPSWIKGREQVMLFRKKQPKVKSEP